MKALCNELMELIEQIFSERRINHFANEIICIPQSFLSFIL